MSKRVLVLVEGQTEEHFVKDILGPAYLNREIYFYPTILVTKRVKDGPNFKGGVTNFAKFSNDVQRLLKNNSSDLVTTMIDYYALPTDFPGMATRPNASPLSRVQHVEDAIAAHFAHSRNFLPFLVLHEFEAWLFSSFEELPIVMTKRDKQDEFSAIRGNLNPEDINEGPETAPSKRIRRLFPAYRKTLHGPTVAKRIGLERIRAACPHLSSWLSNLEAITAH